ncbi:MAG: hypothetical protein ISR84_06345, partial [Kiritimatiellales bacterium]|nr:hypothetical protein [Kiritimatiellales bacterium]
NLIGRSHWLTDGEHKESILRKVISDFAPEVYRVGSGFVCYPSTGENSGQLDILITSKLHPTLYKSGELHFVTPECANAIVEVKTKLANGDNLDDAISKLAEQIANIRKTNQSCWAGLFIYDSGNLSEENILDSLQRISGNDPLKAINCVALGENKLIRYWHNGHSTSGLPNAPIWHGYELRNLAHPYFISNLIQHISPGFSEETAEAWFPIIETKEVNRTHYALLGETRVQPFDRPR